MKEFDIAQEEILGDNPSISLSGVIVDVLDQNQTVELVERYIETGTPLHLMGVNADKINEANRDPRMKQIINRCGVINADGASVVLAGKYLGTPLPERVAGIDLMMRLVEECENRGYSIYLLGAKQQVVEQTARKLASDHPKLHIAGYRNGYFKETDWPEISRQLQESHPDVVFVGITSPLKENLIEWLQNDGHRCVFMGVGGSFDVISGNIPRAPEWMQRMNLEWLFRVMQEPKRLFRRYFVGNVEFMRTVAAEKRKK